MAWLPEAFEGYDVASVGAPRTGSGMRGYREWLDRQSLSGQTRKLYCSYVLRFRDWLDERDLKLSTSLNWKTVRTYSRSLPETYASRNAFRYALRSYGAFSRWEDCPTWAVEVPKRKQGRYRGFTTDQEKDALLEAARLLGPEPYAAICVAYYQALRRFEVAKLRWDEVRSGRIKGVGKGGIEFDRPLHAKVAEALDALTPEGPWVFPSRSYGKHVSPNQVWFWCRLAGEKAGLGRVVPHMLRHTSGAIYCDEVGIRAAADHLRHTSTRHTMVYTRTTADAERRGMEAL